MLATRGLLEEAVRLQVQGEHARAIELYERALATQLPAPLEPAVRYNLALALRAEHRLGHALEQLERALASRADDPELWSALGQIRADRGQPEAAVAAVRRALDLAPSAVHYLQLGNALRACGKRVLAREAYDEALRRDPDLVAAHYNRHATLYRDDHPDPALEALAAVVLLAPDHVSAAFFLHALRRWHGLESAPPLLPREASFLLTSLDFCLEARQPATRMFADTFATLDYAADHVRLDGPIVELGVRFGTTLRHLAARFSSREIHGFDSFQGLPEAWGEQSPGLYSTEGLLPVVPSWVTLHPGYFHATVGPFVAQHDAAVVALVHVDCDLYRSSREALTALAPQITAGTVMVFDDYLCNPGWEAEEHRALTEVAAEAGWQLRYRAFSLFSRQVVVEVV